MISDDAQLEAHLKELRRGSVVVACLLVLRQPGYGYGLLARLEEVGVEVDANTLYPMLRRLENQGLLVSEWDTDGTRPRKYYLTSERGAALSHQLLRAWREISRALDGLDQRGTK